MTPTPRERREAIVYDWIYTLSVTAITGSTIGSIWGHDSLGCILGCALGVYFQIRTHRERAAKEKKVHE